ATAPSARRLVTTSSPIGCRSVSSLVPPGRPQSGGCGAVLHYLLPRFVGGENGLALRSVAGDEEVVVDRLVRILGDQRHGGAVALIQRDEAGEAVDHLETG